ncbi:hypothetical protein EV424DRAFT_1349513 [Suillus variegatus]|nr:hypothetical protein EV424DRAFT_1349513 [Suillus variegatus]
MLYVANSCHGAYHIQNITADNVSVNNKSLRVLGKKLMDKSHDFNATAQHLHCFSHAVALAEGAFLTKLSPSIKKTTLAGMDKGVPMIPPIDPSAEDKDMEDGIEALTQETDTAYASEQTQWGSWNGVIAQMLVLKKAIKMFINTADDSDDVPNVDKNQQKYASYHVSDTEWDLLTKRSANVQEAFAAEYYPIVWQILPLYEDFIIQWQTFSEDPKMAGIMNLEKYYNKTDNSPAHIVSMSNGYFILDLNPCIKDEYFNVAWTKDGQ